MKQLYFVVFLFITSLAAAQTPCPSPFIKSSNSSISLGETAPLEASGCNGLVLWYTENPTSGGSPVEMGDTFYFSSQTIGTVRLYATCQSEVCGVSAPAYFDLNISTGNVINSTNTDNYLKNSSVNSPTAAGLVNYADVPISYNTGLPTISIPLTVVKGSQLSLPISLSYHSEGIKVTDLSSWVGLKWSLFAGGTITRQVMGGPDESWSGSKGEVPDYSSIIYSGNAVNSGFYNDNGFNLPKYDSNNPTPSDVKLNTFKCAGIGYYDTEPDIFSFNVNGTAGKFYFDAQRVAHFIPEQDFKVEVVYAGNPTYEFDTFILISPDGTRYYFGGSAYEKTTTSGGYSSYLGSYLKSSWFLYKVESADRQDVINLSYVDEAYSFLNTKSERYEQGTETAKSPNPWFPYFADNTNIEGKRLSQIVTSQMQVDFIATTQREDVNPSHNYNPVKSFDVPRRLDVVSVRSLRIPSEATKFKLTYDYYQSINQSNAGTFENELWTGLNGGEFEYDKKRLRLLSVQEMSADESLQKTPTVLGYETTPLPRRLSLQRDHGGFYNGQAANRSLVADASYIIPTPNRNYIWSYMKAGHLNKITYPTGGSVDFVFEPHYLDNTKSNSIGGYIGGLRIASMQETFETGNIQVHTYSYDSPRQPLPLTNYSFNFSYPPYSQWQQEFINGTWTYNNTPEPFIQKCQEANITSGFLRIFSSSLYGAVGAFIGSSPSYQFVRVAKVGAGYSDYYYGAIYPKQFYNNAYPFSSGELVNYVNNDKLLSEEHFNALNQRQKRIEYQYNTLPDMNAESLVTAYKWERVSSCSPGVRFAFTKYSYPKIRSLLLAKKEISYDMDGTNPQEGIERYGYGNQHESYIRVSTEKSNTDSLVNERSLAKDYVITSSSLSGMAQRISELQVRNINTEIENRQFIKKSGETNATMQAIGGSLSDFAVFSSNPNLLKMSAVSTLKVGETPIFINRSGIISGLFTADNAYERRASFTYNNAGLLQSEALERGVTTTYGYQNNGLLSSKTLAGVQSIFYNQSDYFGLQQLTDVSGKVQNFVYDKLGRFSSASLANNEITEKLRYVYASSATACHVPAPVVSISNTSLCEVTLVASGCGTGTVVWSNGGVGNSIVVNTKTTSTYSATCSISSCVSSSSTSIRIPMLPSGWNSADVGTPTAGCSQQNGSDLVLLGSGNISNSDAFHYVYKQLSGDFTMIAKVSSLQNIDGLRGGIMLRTSLDPTAIDYTVFQDGNRYVGLFRRETAGGTNVFSGFQEASLNATWLKLVKNGDNLYAYFSTAANPEATNAWASSWSFVNGGTMPQPIPMNGTYYLGLAAWGSANLMTFSNITINGQAF